MINFAYILSLWDYFDRSSSVLIGFITILLLLIFVIIIIICNIYLFLYDKYSKSQYRICFFHPYCNGGGGGERVLWKAVYCIQELCKKYKLKINIIIYTGDKIDKIEILKKMNNHFNIKLDHDSIEFVHLKLRFLVEAWLYPRFTMIGQSIGSMILAWEALWHCPPHLFIDTTGYAFSYPLASIFFGAKVLCYTHYPTISEDMLGVVKEQRYSYNNTATTSSSSQIKLYYYQLFAWLYSMVGRYSNLVLVNSKWTYGHITILWRRPLRTLVLHPPCDVNTFRQIPFEQQKDFKTNIYLKGRRKWIISIGQFRPEKDHNLQLLSFAEYLKKPNADKDLRLILIGGCRDLKDELRVVELRKKAQELKIADRVDFQVNVSYEKLKEYLSSALIGIHTMWNEHFGISVVELMASGVITIAHNSGGPKSDIIVPWNGRKTGFLAETPKEYANAIDEIIDLCEKNSNDINLIRDGARQRVNEFDDKNFEIKFTKVLKKLLKRQ